MWRQMQARLGVMKGCKYHPCFNIKADGECKGVVFFMHGLGDQGMGWAGEFANQAHPNVRYVFPSANNMPVSLNNGMEMPSWFDIKDLSSQTDERYDMGKIQMDRNYALMYLSSTKYIFLNFSSIGEYVRKYSHHCRRNPYGGEFNKKKSGYRRI